VLETNARRYFPDSYLPIRTHNGIYQRENCHARDFASVKVELTS